MNTCFRNVCVKKICRKDKTEMIIFVSVDGICVCFIVLVSLSEALCPEEAESALEATQFFTDDDTPQGM